MHRAMAWLVMLTFLGGCHLASSPGVEPPRSPAAAQGTASVALRVAFPERTAQALVANTQSVKILLRDADGHDLTRTVDTGAPTTVQFEGLAPGGGYTLYAAGYSGLNATGIMLSWGKLPVTLASGRNQLSLSLSVVMKAGAGAADLVTGPSGNGAIQLGAQKVFTTMRDFQAPGMSASNIEPFDPAQNTYLAKFGSLGSQNGEFGSHIQMLAIDSKGRIWVSDDINERVLQFDKDGVFLRGIGSDTVWTSASSAPIVAQGTTNYGFKDPAGLAVDAQDNLYVSDVNNRRILKYDASGNFLMGFGGNQVWVAPATASIPAHRNDTGYFRNYGLDLDRNGNIYIGGYSDNRAYVFSPSGQFLRAIGQGTTWTATASVTWATGSVPSTFNSCWHVRVDKTDGTMYVSDFNERVQVFTSNGDYVRTISTVTADKPDQRTAGFFELGPDGNVYVAAYGSNPGPNFYQVFTRTGTLLSRFGEFGTGNGQLQNPETIAWAPDGAFWTVDRDGSRVQKWRSANPADPAGALRLRGHRQPGPAVYVGPGVYETPPIDAGASITWGAAYWDIPTLPAGTQVTVEAGRSNDGVNWTWSLVSGTPGTGRTAANLVGVTGRYCKLRLTMSTTNSALSPIIQEVGVLY
ncbi:NHL repeat-containing protein [bacterium]|nr:NHL repeat-containing protein [bacterium]